MTGSETSRPFRYRGTRLPRLCARFPVRFGSVVALAFGLATGGCSFSYQLGSLFGGDEAPAQSASITPADPAKTGQLPPDGDLVFARAAAAELLARGAPHASVPWENPRTGARGTVTQVASSYTQDGLECRDFLASYVRAGAESWLEGEACRARGKWEVRALRPLKRS